MANQDTPVLSGWPIAHPYGINFAIQAGPANVRVASNDTTNPPGGLPVPLAYEPTLLFPSEQRG